jgi:hypothetical protein
VATGRPHGDIEPHERRPLLPGTVEGPEGQDLSRAAVAERDLVGRLDAAYELAWKVDGHDPVTHLI